MQKNQQWKTQEVDTIDGLLCFKKSFYFTESGNKGCDGPSFQHEEHVDQLEPKKKK